jgi:hypothetical protein
LKKRSNSSACSLASDCQELLHTHRELLAKMDGIEKRLFYDNGTKSIQTRIERHEQILRVLLWATSIVVGAVLTAGVFGLIVVFKWAIAQRVGL